MVREAMAGAGVNGEDGSAQNLGSYASESEWTRGAQRGEGGLRQVYRKKEHVSGDSVCSIR